MKLGSEIDAYTGIRTIDWSSNGENSCKTKAHGETPDESIANFSIMGNALSWAVQTLGSLVLIFMVDIATTYSGHMILEVYICITG